MARGFLGGLHIGLERRGLNVPLASRTSRVHVNCDEGLCLVDYQITPGLQRHGGRIDLAEVVLDPVLDEQRHRFAVSLNLLGLGRHQHAHEVAGFLEAGFALDPHLVDILVVKVAYGALNEILLLIDQGRGHGVQGGVADVFPKSQQIFVVAADLGLGALGTCRANDQAHALWHIQALHHAFQALAVSDRGDLARNAAASCRIGHQDAIAPGQGEIGGERRTLVAALFLHDLNQHDLPTADHFLDLVAPHEPPATPGDLFFHDVIVVVTRHGVFLVVVFGRWCLGARLVVVVFFLSLFAH